MTILAIDPGAGGGMAAWVGEGPATARPMPATEGDVIAAIRELHPDGVGTAYMEQLVKHMGPGTPASTMAVYASNYGLIKGALMMAGWRLELVTPQAWQKALGLGITGRQKIDRKVFTDKKSDAYKAEAKRIASINQRLKKEWKDKLKAASQRLFPDIKVTLGTADALLILRYAQLREAGSLAL